MNIWIIKSNTGWIVRKYNGDFIAYENFMCNCKCHAMRLHLKWKRISNRSSFQEIKQYKDSTGLKYATYIHP